MTNKTFFRYIYFGLPAGLIRKQEWKPRLTEHAGRCAKSGGLWSIRKGTREGRECKRARTNLHQRPVARRSKWFDRLGLSLRRHHHHIVASQPATPPDTAGNRLTCDCKAAIRLSPSFSASLSHLGLRSCLTSRPRQKGLGKGAV